MGKIIACLLLLFSIIFNQLVAQDQENDNELTLDLGLYLDLFYGYDFNRPVTASRLPYLYHHNRHNEVNLNHGLISVALSNQRFRSNLSFQAGTYVDDNYTNEKGILKNIYDANAGLSLDQNSRWWIDIGIFGSSWIGMESTLSIENMNLSHNLISENVPYYYSGIKLGFEPNLNWRLSVILTNGWQRIQRVEGNSMISSGTEISYTSKSNNSLLWSTFIGTDDPDSTRRIRFYNHINGYLNVGESVRLGAGFDLGLQQESLNSSNWEQWYGLALMARYSFNANTSLAMRYEYYHDPMQVIVESLNPSEGYKTSGLTVNLDHRIFKVILLRLETRWFTSPDQIYPREGESLVENNVFILGSIALSLNKDALNE